jgi:hypothetical protein
LLDDSGDPVQIEDSGQLCMVLSEAAMVGKESSRSMRLLGQIQGHDVLILVDSRSSHTFVSATLVANMSGVSKLHNTLAVKVANGNSLVCSLQLQQAKWEVQGFSFYSDFNVLPLHHFDIILGYDWLELHSPMEMHWSAKFLVRTVLQ